MLVGVVAGLIALKVVAGWLTGSISILAQTADSLLDLIAGIVTFFAIRIAARPADKEHPYGHGKVEDVAGLTQGVLIFIAGGLIIYSAIRRIVEGSAIELVELGIGIMLISIVTSLLLSRHLLRVARATGSVALEANAHNIATDVYSALAVLIGLALVRFTGIAAIDSMIAIGVAFYIMKVAYDTIRRPLSGLIDTKLPSLQEAVIENCLNRHRAQIVGFHDLRTRRSGNQSYIDLHLVLDRDMSLEQAHQVCDQIEAEIQKELPESNLTIHAEPCSDECEHCSVICTKRRNKQRVGHASTFCD